MKPKRQFPVDELEAGNLVPELDRDDLILQQSREPQEHFRGCWILDLLDGRRNPVLGTVSVSLLGLLGESSGTAPTLQQLPRHQRSVFQSLIVIWDSMTLAMTSQTARRRGI